MLSYGCVSYLRAQYLVTRGGVTDSVSNHDISSFTMSQAVIEDLEMLFQHMTQS